MTDTIFIKDLRFFAYHGHLPVERKTGNTFVVDVEISCDLKPSGQSDDLNDTVDYVRVMEICEEEMKTPSDLIEHVAERIATRLRKELTLIQQVKVTVKKQKPPLRFDLNGVEVTIVR